MLQYVVKRILWLIPIMLGVSFIVFTIMYMSPGDPVTMVLGEGATPEQYEAMRIQMGLDKGFFEQFFHYIKDVIFDFDLGKSHISGRSVMEEILVRLPNTIKLAVLSVFVASCIGIPLGVISATRPYSKTDNVVMFLSLIGVSMPTFWQALLLIILFTSTLGWLPASGFTTWQQMIMPVTVTFSHALRNSLLPVVTVIGLQFGALLGGAVLTETIFSINGIGTLMVNAIRTRDTMIVQGGVLFIAFIFSMVNLSVDILYAYIDPRIKTMYE